MSALKEAILSLEPVPPDEVKPRRPPAWDRLSISVSRPPGCVTWRASVFVALDSAEPPAGLEESFGSAAEAWDAALSFVERHLSRGAP